MKHYLPPISSRLQLAGRLKLNPQELHWLLNQGRSKTDSAASSKHYRCRWIRKRSAGWRLIEAPKSKLRYVQRILLEQIFSLVPPHPLSFGFCRGRNVLDFAKPHTNKESCLRFDLADFFASVTTGRVVGLLRKLGYNRDVAHAIALLTTVQTCHRALTVDHPESAFSGQSPQFRRRHLPQGAPTSPAIANLCAYRLDLRLSAVARSVGGVCYSRYADDILFSGDVDLARQSKRLATLVGAIAIEEGFELNYRKTRLLRSSQRQAVAGMVLNEKLNVSRDRFDRLKATLHNCVKFGPESQNREVHPAFRAHLDGRIQWVETVNANRGQKLRTIFERIVW